MQSAAAFDCVLEDQVAVHCLDLHRPYFVQKNLDFDSILTVVDVAVLVSGV